MSKKQRIKTVPPLNLLPLHQVSLSSTAVDLQGPPLSVWARGCTQDPGNQGRSGKFTHMPF